MTFLSYSPQRRCASNIVNNVSERHFHLCGEQLKISKKSSNQPPKKHPKSMKNRPGSLPKRHAKNKWTKNLKKIGKVWILGSNLVPGEGKNYALFAYFSSLGHPWGPKWFQDSSQELLGLPKLNLFMILGRFFIHLLSFVVFRWICPSPSAGTVAGLAGMGSWIIIKR